MYPSASELGSASRISWALNRSGHRQDPHLLRYPQWDHFSHPPVSGLDRVCSSWETPNLLSCVQNPLLMGILSEI